MMKKIIWSELSDQEKIFVLKRPESQSGNEIAASVRAILDDVRDNGDRAVRRLTQRFDRYDPLPLFVSKDEIEGATDSLDKGLRAAIDLAYANIRAFHAGQGYRPYAMKTMPGLHCARTVIPVQRVGIYIPGGTAPLFSAVLMQGIPSQLAGNPERLLCTPARSGQVHPAMLYAAKLCGIDAIARVGGAQAIAMMAYGTETVQPVDKIFGPGNAYVNLAKRMVAAEVGGPAIDMPAGPSEVLVVATDETPADYAAADLLAQAEHDVSSQVVLIALSAAKRDDILLETERQLEALPRAAITRQALDNSLAIVVDSVEEALAISNRYAPEHLILCFEGAERYVDLVTSAGSVFCGPNTPEPLGDYASGTNHVLPTGGGARAYSGGSVEAFQKTVTVQSASSAALRAIGPAVVTMAQNETLDAHANAVLIRMQSR
jgi:histidinol dehydrogenase